MKKPEITLAWWVFMGIFLVSVAAIVVAFLVAIRNISADVNVNSDRVIIGIILFAAIFYSITNGMVLSMWLVLAEKAKEKRRWICNGKQ